MTWMFAVYFLPVNLTFGYLCWFFHRNSDGSSSRKLLRISLVHAFGTFGFTVLLLICVHKKDKDCPYDWLRTRLEKLIVW